MKGWYYEKIGATKHINNYQLLKIIKSVAGEDFYIRYIHLTTELPNLEVLQKYYVRS